MPNEKKDHRGKRMRRDPTPSFPLLGWRYPGPSVYWDLETDNDGFLPNRRGEQSAIDREAEIRVWLVGGSTMAGAGASANDRTIAACLERDLRTRHGKRISVVNAGVGGWYSQNELAFLAQELLPLHRPDAVVVMNGYNDTWRAVVAGAKFEVGDHGDYVSSGNYLYDPRLEGEVFEVLKRSGDQSGTPGAARDGRGRCWLSIRNTYAGEFLWGVSCSRKIEEVGVDGVQVDRLSILQPPLNVDPYLANVRSCVALAIGWRMPLLYVLQPSVVYKKTLTAEELSPLENIRRKTLAGGWSAYKAERGCDFDDIQRRFFDGARPGFLDLGKRLNSETTQLVDFSRLFENETEDLFYDYCHYTDRGNELIANAIVSELEPILQRPGIRIAGNHG